MEKKEVTTATPLSKVDLNTKFLGLAGSELVQMPFSAFPEATTEQRGLMSTVDKTSNPSSISLRRYVSNPNIALNKAYRIKFTNPELNGSASIKVYGTWNYGIAVGCIRKVLGFTHSPAAGLNKCDNSIYECSLHTCARFYITDPFVISENVCIDIINRAASGPNNCLIIIETFGYAVEFLLDQEPLAENLTKNNRDETAFVLKPAALSLLSNENSEALPPPPRKGWDSRCLRHESTRQRVP